MFGKRVKLFTLLGFDVKIDASWIILALLITWTLATGYFPVVYPDLTQQTYWWMGIGGALGLFASIVIHEFAHSLVARRHGIQMKGITLFIFGGVAEMDAEPPTAKAEFRMAIAGPIASVALAIVFYLSSLMGQAQGWPAPLTGVLEYLGFINAILVAFNIIPAFPLDGGRVLRAFLWGRSNNLRQATRTASAIGAGFGMFLIFMGVFAVLGGNFVGGLWWFLIGMFLRGASQMSYQQLEVRKALEGEPVARFMKTDPVSVAPSLSIRDLVDDYMYKYHFQMFPVVENSKLMGCVSTKEVKEVPREQWSEHTVQESLKQCSEQNTISSDTDAVEALALMKRSGGSRMMVVDNGRLVGVVTLKDLLDFLSLKLDLEGEDGERTDSSKRQLEAMVKGAN